MYVNLIVVAYNSGNDLIRLVHSARSRHDLRTHIYVHSRDEATLRACERMSDVASVRIEYFGTNRGLAQSWNDGLLYARDDGADVAIVANDDIVFGATDIDALANCAGRHSDAHIVTCSGWDALLAKNVPSHGMACFATGATFLDVLGCFDENFFPAYFEDDDIRRRAVLAGLREEHCETGVVHQHSGTIRRDPELRARNTETQLRNEIYYLRKWGGLRGDEPFRTPFDQPNFGFKIEPDRRHHPYGTWDRPELTELRSIELA